MVSDLGCSTRNTSVNFDPGNLENFQAPSVDPLPRSDMNLCELSQSLTGTVAERLGQSPIEFCMPNILGNHVLMQTSPKPHLKGEEEPDKGSTTCGHYW